MGRVTKRGTKGTAAQHLTRGSALKKLQLSLADFRRLCILKGIYPRDPKKKAKGRDKTYYHAKDIGFLNHEPLVQKFRDLKVHNKKYRRAIGRHEPAIARSLAKRKPVYALFHLVKERYPTLVDCIRDLDDALSSLALFASLPADDEKTVTTEVIADATRLFDEFLVFAVEKKLLRKVFCSIKGYYLQLQYLGQTITFLVPHQFPQELPADVDFKVMLTFLEFYRCVLKSLNFKLYNMEGLAYPPTAQHQMVKGGCRFLALKCKALEAVAETDEPSAALDGNVKHKLESKLSVMQKEEEEMSDEEGEEEGEEETGFEGDETIQQMNQISAQEKVVQELFNKKVFFLSREIPRVPIAFMLKSCGAEEVGWQGEFSPIAEDDGRITHHVLDRPLTSALEQFTSIREFVQPQWIFDSINGTVCLPVTPYRSGIPPPPHLSPFVDDLKEGYVPQQRLVLDSLTRQLKTSDEEEEEVSEGEDEDVEVNEEKELEFQAELKKEVEGVQSIPVDSDKTKQKKKQEAKQDEEKERRKALLSKKHKRLLDRIEYGKSRASEKVAKLQSKRAK